MGPLVGILYHWLGGLAAGSFYVPFKKVKNWSWEVYWLVNGAVAWIIIPALFALLMTNDLVNVISSQSASTIFWAMGFGMLWGIGGLTFGLSVRYLGLSLGVGLTLGFCAIFGTLVPPIVAEFFPNLYKNTTISGVYATLGGKITLLGILVCVIGIVVSLLAGLSKENELSAEEKKKSIVEANFPLGLIVSFVSGILSACFAFALSASSEIGESSKTAGTDALWSGLPSLIVILLGGFCTNFFWCMYLSFKNKSFSEYIGGNDQKTPLANNYFFSALAGLTWYMQFFFYTMGETQMGEYGFASWTLHMASIIIFSNLWGLYFKEWQGTSKKTRTLIFSGIAILVISTMIVGLGTWKNKVDESNIEKVDEVKNIIQLNARHQNKLKVRL